MGAVFGFRFKINPASFYCEQFADAHSEMVSDNENRLDLVRKGIQDEAILIAF
jgi:hypothetical protein